MNCEFCSNEFVARHSRHRFCSAKCRDGYRYVNDSADRRAKKREYNRKYQQSDRGIDNRNKRASANQEERRTYHRGYTLKYKYGITIDQYNELLAKQGGGCAVCGKTQEEEKRHLAVDHDHKTNEIYGILCYFCNHKLIGKHRDPEKFERAAAYLREGTGWFVPPKKRRRRTTRKVNK